MFLAIRNGEVVQRSSSIDSLLKLDKAQHEVIEWDSPLPPHNPELDGLMPDPRDTSQRAQDARGRYKRLRQREYPSIFRQLDMMYWDAVNGTTTWVDEITRIKGKYPRPI